MTYIPGGGSGGSIATSSDVALNNPADSDALIYDAATAKWTNASTTLADGTVTKLKLETAVQNSLDKADTALQTAPVTSVNTQTGAVALTATDVGAAAATLTRRTVSASYTVVAADAIDTLLHADAATGLTVTLPSDTDADISLETAIPWRQYGSGQINFVAGTGASLVSRGSVFNSAGQYAEGLLTKVAANSWLLSGDITA